MTAYFSVKGWEKHQHYKDRAPPWIKLHVALLEDYEFGCLQDASKAHLLAIWLLASKHDNRIPLDPTWVGRRINASDPVDLDALVKAGFLVIEGPAKAETQAESTLSQDASDTLAGRSENATSENREQRTETEKDAQKASPSSPRAKPGRDPLGTRLPEEWGLSEELFEWSMTEARAPPSVIHAEVPRFRDYWRAKPGASGRKTDWDATWRNWLRKAMERADGGRNGPGPRQRSYLDGVREFARTAGGGPDHSAEDGFPR